MRPRGWKTQDSGATLGGGFEPNPIQRAWGIAVAQILVLDDDDLIQDMLRGALERKGHQVTVASDGQRGLEIVRGRPFDVALVDIVMPGKGGIEIVMDLHREFPRLHTILMTGKLDVELESFVRLARQFGVRRIIRKPFELQDILEAVRLTLEPE